MEAERYVVRELEGFNITGGSQGTNSCPSLEVSVLDSWHNFRIVQAFRSEEITSRGIGGGPGTPTRAQSRTRVRAQAAELAARLNEATP